MLVILTLFSAVFISAEDNTAPSEIHLHLFYGQGCPHCSQLRLFLDKIQPDYPNLIIHEHEVYSDNEGRALFEQMSAHLQVQKIRRRSLKNGKFPFQTIS